ncbi:MAG: transposase [Candidatus Bathyarchaeales archaeon]
MLTSAKTVQRKKKERIVSNKAFNFTANLLNKYLQFPAAKNSLYSSSDINHCPIELSLSKNYAESGLACPSEKYSLPNRVPTGRTFRGRIERLAEKQIREALIAANDEVLLILRCYSIFKRKATVAIDYTRQPFYGDPATKNVTGGKHERGTSWGYIYASIDVVEAGRRLTVYSCTVNQFSEKAEIVEKLITKARERGIHISVVLLDREFFTVSVISALKRLGVYFIMPAVKNDTVKEAMLNYSEKKPAKRFTLGKKSESVNFNLYLCKRTAEQLPKKKLAVSDLYFGFATNLPRSLAIKLPLFIPQEYRRRWGIETGYRVQNHALAKTTSVNFKLRLLYQMASVLLYNVWHFANFLLCRALKRQFDKPILALTWLAVHFEGFVVGGLRATSALKQSELQIEETTA